VVRDGAWKRVFFGSGRNDEVYPLNENGCRKRERIISAPVPIDSYPNDFGFAIFLTDKSRKVLTSKEKMRWVERPMEHCTTGRFKLKPARFNKSMPLNRQR